MLQIRLLQSRTQTIAILLIAAVGIVTATLASPVSAHEGRDVGEYNLVVGFLIEPAYEGQLNGVSLVVTRAANHEAAEDDSMMETKMEAEDHDSQPRSRTADVDVLTHGAVFISPWIGTQGKLSNSKSPTNLAASRSRTTFTLATKKEPSPSPPKRRITSKINPS